MTSGNPFTAVQLKGDTTIRGVTLALNRETVQGFLPEGLELGEQRLTDSGHHPVLLFFNDMFKVRVSVPSLVPSLTYHEHQFGIPYTYLAGSVGTPRSGPYYFMPKLHLDNWLAVIGGLTLWGLAKEMTWITVTERSYIVTSLSGQRLATLNWVCKGRFEPLSHYPLFVPIRQILEQPIVTRAPASVGPFFSLADLYRNWDKAMLRPLSTSLQVDVAYVQGYQCGRTPASGWSPSIDTTSMGSYELRVPWRFSLPYPPPFFGLGSLVQAWCGIV